MITRQDRIKKSESITDRSFYSEEIGNLIGILIHDYGYRINRLSDGSFQIGGLNLRFKDSGDGVTMEIWRFSHTGKSPKFLDHLTTLIQTDHRFRNLEIIEGMI